MQTTKGTWPAVHLEITQPSELLCETGGIAGAIPI